MQFYYAQPTRVHVVLLMVASTVILADPEEALNTMVLRNSIKGNNTS